MKKNKNRVRTPEAERANEEAMEACLDCSDIFEKVFHGDYDPRENVIFKGADNVYMTRDFIVSQRLLLYRPSTIQGVLMSNDTYYRKTPQRENNYKIRFDGNESEYGGKRIRTCSYRRKYVY